MKRRAFALVAVLVALTAASASASVAAANARADLAQARAIVTRAQLSAAIEGALAKAVVDMITPAGASVALDGRPVFATELGGARVIVRVLPEAARVDINRAPPDQLERLFLATGISASATNRAMRWIALRRGATFISVVEIAAAFEDPDDFVRAAPYLTVRGQALPDARFAPEPVLAAIGMDAGARAALITARGNGASTQIGPTLGPLAMFLKAQARGGATQVDEQVIALNAKGFILLERRPGEEARILPETRP